MPRGIRCCCLPSQLDLIADHEVLWFEPRSGHDLQPVPGEEREVHQTLARSLPRGKLLYAYALLVCSNETIRFTYRNY
jgi:hypothetical protein